MRHRRFVPLLGFLPADLLLAMNACNSSSSSGGPGPTVTHTATKTATATSTAPATPTVTTTATSTVPATPTATPTASGACTSGTQRELDVTNNSSQTRLGIWWGRGASRRLCGERHADLPDGQFQRVAPAPVCAARPAGASLVRELRLQLQTAKIASARAVPNVDQVPVAIPPPTSAFIRSPLRPRLAALVHRVHGTGNCLQLEIPPSFVFPRVPSRSMVSRCPPRCGGAAELVRVLDVAGTEPTA
jgi:hypothetical protein